LALTAAIAQLIAGGAMGARAFWLLVAVTITCCALWIARHPQERMAAKLILVALGFAVVCVASSLYLTWAGRAEPLKYDSALLSLDAALHISPFAIARAVRHSALLTAFCRAVYASLELAIVACWIGLSLSGSARSARFVVAVLMAFGGGCLLYLLVPACGPAYAFPGFPVVAAAGKRSLMRFDGNPNCVPSLHLAAAMLIFRFRGGGWISRAWPWLFLPLTALATLSTGEHYAVDLLLAVPFALACEMAAERRWRPALVAAAATLAPMLAIRLAV
jgi:hypothetical protein